VLPLIAAYNQHLNQVAPPPAAPPQPQTLDTRRAREYGARMKALTKHAPALAFALVALLTLLLLWPLARRASVRLTGAVMPDSTRTHTYADKPVMALSVGGERWKTWGKTERGSAYHALIVLPPVPFSDDGSVSGGDGFTYTNIHKWSARTGPQGGYEGKSLEVTYDATAHTVRLGTRVYSLADGNLFVILFDEGWRPGVTQLDVSIKEEMQVDLDLFKSLLRGDEAIQKL
jgi:hypothetical protein